MRLWLMAAVAMGGLVALAPRPAQACGGTFCDAGPSVMPVDQEGENVLFVVEDGMVEAHVQIQYSGDPEAFAWLVPVMTRPEIEPGSDALFRELLLGTVPTFVTNPINEDCGPGRDGRNGQQGCGGGFPRAFAESADAGGDFGGVNDPEVVERGIVGAFEFAVLEGGTVEGVQTWLDENGYAQDDDAPTELQGYLDKDFLFVAFKLRGGAGSDQIHPVVLRYPGDEPCVPIRLTRIAATDDMGVRVFFLGEERVVPSNYRHVEINLAAIDWQNLGSNYQSVVTQAVDDDGSDGHGFVTEYAGASGVVWAGGVLGPAWNAARLRERSAGSALSELAEQGLLACGPGGCTSQHPLLPGLLQTYLPRPSGVPFEAYYACLSCYEGDLESWDAEAFADEVEARIIGPAEHAVDLLATFPYLTRLYTTLSPHEMTLDPVFHENPDLPEVSNVHRVDRVFTCEGPDYIEFEDGSRLALAASPDAEQPAALRVEDVPLRGAPMTVVDREEQVVAARRAWNDAQGLDAGDGCNCYARARSGSGLGWMALMVGLGLWARRPRRRAAATTHRSS